MDTAQITSDAGRLAGGHLAGAAERGEKSTAAGSLLCLPASPTAAVRRGGAARRFRAAYCRLLPPTAASACPSTGPTGGGVWLAGSSSPGPSRRLRRARGARRRPRLRLRRPRSLSSVCYPIRFLADSSAGRAMAWLPPSLFVANQNYEFRASADEHLNGRVAPTDFCPYDVVGTSRRQRRPSRSLRGVRRSACAPLSPAQCFEAAPRLLCGACAEVGSERAGKPSLSCVQFAGDK